MKNMKSWLLAGDMSSAACLHRLHRKTGRKAHLSAVREESRRLERCAARLLHICEIVTHSLGLRLGKFLSAFHQSAEGFLDLSGVSDLHHGGKLNGRIWATGGKHQISIGADLQPGAETKISQHEL